MKLQIIQLEPYDDVISVRDRLSFIKAERALLLWPPTPPGTTPILCRKLDIVLILREAARRGIWLALVADEPDIIDHARDLNISVFRDVRASQRKSWKKPLRKVFVDRADRPASEPDPYELMLHASRLRVLSPRQRAVRRAVRVVTLGVVALVALALAYVLLPGGVVRLWPAQGQIDTTVTLVVDALTTERSTWKKGVSPAHRSRWT
jgi:hypothetical protein